MRGMKVLELGKRAPIGADKWRFYFNRERQPR
jgi:hypothetical protein